jgi:hypothetical protein
MPRRARRAIVAVESKAWYESKTVWFNIVSFVVVILGLILESTGQLGISSKGVAWLGLAVAVGNAWLRFSTSQPVSGSGGNLVPVEGKPADPMTPDQMLAIAEYLRDLGLRQSAARSPGSTEQDAVFRG